MRLYLQRRQLTRALDAVLLHARQICDLRDRLHAACEPLVSYLKHERSTSRCRSPYNCGAFLWLIYAHKWLT